MTLVALTIPDDPDALPAWLEQRLVSADFGRFVAELSAAYPTRDAGISARELLSTCYHTAVSDGLAAVPVEILRQLLRHPQSLLDFQEVILTEGGPHWDEVASRATELEPAVQRGRVALERLLDTRAAPRARDTSRSRSSTETTEPRAPEPRGASQERFYRRWAVVSTALAACLLIALGVVASRSFTFGDRGQQAELAWGWDRPEGIPPAESKPTDYLNGLAKSAEEWFDDRPADAPALARRINELRTGCSRLILSPHTPLSPQDKKWLTAKCRAWAANMDAHLAALEAGADPRQVRGQVDETVTKLVKALRDRASQAD